MDWYGIRGKTNIWIRNWLTSRTQTVVVVCERSEEVKVPQGTVLGPLLFILFINDIGENTSSTIRLFADDCVIYRNIKSQSDAATLQKDLNTLVSWAKNWQMSFNVKECTLLCVTRKRKIINHTYKMMGNTLEQMEHHPYLGVELSADLEWKHHVKAVTRKAHRSLNFLQRNMYKCPLKARKQAYMSLIRPTLEYASTCWDPYHKNEIALLESVQRKAARFIRNDFRRTTSVTALMEELELPALQHRREISRLSMLYKIHHEEVAVHIPPCYTQSTKSSVKTRYQHSGQYTLITPRTDTYKYSFYPRTLPAWNRLPLSTITAPSVKMFSSQIQTPATSKKEELYIGSASTPAGASTM